MGRGRTQYIKVFMTDPGAFDLEASGVYIGAYNGVFEDTNFMYKLGYNLPISGTSNAFDPSWYMGFKLKSQPALLIEETGNFDNFGNSTYKASFNIKVGGDFTDGISLTLYTRLLSLKEKFQDIYFFDPLIGNVDKIFNCKVRIRTPRTGNQKAVIELYVETTGNYNQIYQMKQLPLTKP